MANICENNLKVYSEDIRNIEYIKEFFSKDADIEEEEECILELRFSSKLDFPIKWMDKLYEGLPNKNDIDMVCLSIELEDMYCTFHSCNKEGWSID